MGPLTKCLGNKLNKLGKHEKRKGDFKKTVFYVDCWFVFVLFRKPSFKKKQLCLTVVFDSWVVFLPPDVEKRDNPVCHFVTPLDGSIGLDIHRPAEVKKEKWLMWRVHMAKCSCTDVSGLPNAWRRSTLPFFWCWVVVILVYYPLSLFLPQVAATEGKCWKTRIEIVIREYHKWRTYFKKRVLYFLKASLSGGILCISCLRPVCLIRHGYLSDSAVTETQGWWSLQLA